MHLGDKVIIVTGGAHGIGRALCHRFSKEKPAGLIIGDIDIEAARDVACRTGGHALRADVSIDTDIERLVEYALSNHGRVDMFCSNAGVFLDGGLETTPAQWQKIWKINVGAHITAARLVLPSMLARRQGCLLNTVSAAGLLTMIGSAPYTVTKHAALSFAEWLSITYADSGIHVSALCPLGVKTAMLGNGSNPVSAWMAETAIEPEQVAEAAIAGLREKRFLILPHPEVLDFVQRKSADHERWMAGMRRLQARVMTNHPAAAAATK